MARRKTSEPPKSAELTHDAMRRAIPKIEARIRDIDAFDATAIIERGDPRASALETKLSQTLSAIFPPGTHEHNLYLRENANRIDNAPIRMMMPGELMFPDEVQKILREGLAQARSMWVTMREGFEEELRDSGLTPAEKAIKAYAGLELHPEIEKAAAKLFHDGHYSEAVEKAMKGLTKYVKFRSEVADKDGVDLMQHVFREKEPVLRFNDGVSESDRSEQRGFMMMFSGAVAALRNPRAHDIIEDEPETALEYIAYISLLAKLTDRADHVAG